MIPDMPHLDLKDGSLHYRFDGPEAAPVLVFSNSLGTNFGMWDPQIPAMARHFRVLRYDTRGHGLSAVTPGPYSIEQLGRDALGLLDGLKIDKVCFCGLSMGGMTGMWLGVNAPERLDRLILANTASLIGNREIWNARIEQVRQGGMASIAESVLQRWFTPSFLASAPDRVERVRQMLLQTAAAGYIGNCEAVREMDQREAIARIATPTLVITGSKDPATPAAEGRFVAGRIAGAKYVELETAHLSNIEAAEEFTAAISTFLLAPTERTAQATSI
jgi:3-oxoadipate enol-lactonase